MSPFHTFIQIPNIIKETICSYELFTLHLNTCRINTFKHHSVCYLPFRIVGNNIQYALPTFGYLKDHIITREGNKKNITKNGIDLIEQCLIWLTQKIDIALEIGILRIAIMQGKNYMFSYDSTQNIDTCVIYSPDLCR